MALIVLLVFGIPIALTIWLIVRAVRAQNRIEELFHRLIALESEVARLKIEKELPKPVGPGSAPPSQPKIVTPAPVTPPRPVAAPQPVISSPHPPTTESPPFSEPPRPLVAKIDWEQFVGVKGFAWVGGLALFLGVVFFVKYSFDNNLVPPVLRVTIGFLTGLGLLVGGVVMSRKSFPVLSQTLCATGVVILYSVTFACRSIYHFDFFGPIPTFLLMALITTTAFLLAIRLNALVVAILGMLGGFLTPVLLSTGQDNPLGLFGYIAILDAGLIVVALNRRWFFLTALAAFGTAFMQISWAGEFFVSEKYFEGNKILIALAVLLGFNALFLAANWWAKTWRPLDNEESSIFGIGRVRAREWLLCSALGLVAVTFAFTAWFLDFEPLAQRPWLMFGFIFLVDLGVIALVLADDTIAVAQSIAGLAVFGLLGFWTQAWLTDELLNAALAFYFLFAIAHSALPAFLQRRRGIVTPTWANHLFPVLALALVLVPVFTLAAVSFVVWPFILLVDLLAIALAVLTATLLPVLAVLLLTLAATGELIFKIPSDLTGLSISFFLLAAFAVFFAAVSIWLVKEFQPDALTTGIKFNNNLDAPGDFAAILPACSVVLPFLLLIMATLRLPLINPSPVFGLALLLVVLLLGVAKLFSIDWMPAVGLACVTALECAWHFSHFEPTNPNQPLGLVLTWYLIFFAVFALFPFLFWKQFSNKVVPWATSAMAGPPQFFLIHRFVSAVYPNQAMGLLPAAFAIPGLLSLVAVLKKVPEENKSRMAQLAWFGGVALFFITLIFPIQFDRQWITIGWALEGMALLWLFHRVPHPGLRLTGVGLLIAAFLRLAFNPAVLDYHPRAAMPIFNWYLYAYGIVTVCLFAGSKLLAPPRNRILEANVPPLLAGCGTVLAFLLMNIEIADYFSEPGSTLTFELGGNFARDMTYSIGWA
ncbi:MAG: DUF2339 domain-containing protein, partial [Candidatus Binatus sp.]